MTLVYLVLVDVAKRQLAQRLGLAPDARNQGPPIRDTLAAAYVPIARRS
jgi:hypothetical protein